jgi:hypothetical protein
MTKLLDEPTESPTADLAWTKLINEQSSPGHLVKTEETPTVPHESPTSSDPPKRRESVFGTFHRQLRMSLKAVSETPGPLTRLVNFW